MALNSKIRAKSFFRGAYFLPNILGALVVGYIFNYFFTYILPAVGEMIGWETLSSSLLSSKNLAWIAIVIVCAWQAIAMNTLIYISGLQTVPEDVYEAGAIDRATGWNEFKNLAFPLIVPFFTINMVLCVKNFLMVFDQIMALTKGGPAQSTESISYLIYQNGIDVYKRQESWSGKDFPRQRQRNFWRIQTADELLSINIIQSRSGDWHRITNCVWTAAFWGSKVQLRY